MYLSNRPLGRVRQQVSARRRFFAAREFVSYLLNIGATRQGGPGMPVPRFIIAICLAGTVSATAPELALAQESKRPDKVSFYFAAHEDDWQLFMNPSAFEDV